MINMSPQVALKLKHLLLGEEVICSDADLEQLESGAPWATAKRLASVPNPKRCGLLDAYIAYLK